MRTLHVVATFGRGGIATSLWHLLPALNQEPGQEVAGAVFYDKGWFGGLLEEAGIPIQEFGMGGKYDPRILLRLVNLFKDYDVVHAHGWPIILFVAMASLFVRRPCFVLSEHSVTNRRRRPILKWLDRWIYNRFDRVVAVSRAVADSLEEWLPHLSDKITVIYNGINPENFNTAESKVALRQRLNLPVDAPVLFASGNFRFAKGFDLLLQSIAHLLDKYRQHDARGEVLPVLVITGEGELQQSMAELAQRLDVSDQVRFLGFRTDMPEILRSADLFVLSSRWEGCPMVVLEAMSLEVPILATNVGGVPELIYKDQTGVLVSPGDPDLLGNSLYDLLHKPKEAKCMAEQGRQRLLNSFSIENSAASMSRLYRQALGMIF